VVALKDGRPTVCALGLETLICLAGKPDQRPEGTGVRS
jgi:hypothetical protein